MSTTAGSGCQCSFNPDGTQWWNCCHNPITRIHVKQTTDLLKPMYSLMMQLAVQFSTFSVLTTVCFYSSSVKAKRQPGWNTSFGRHRHWCCKLSSKWWVSIHLLNLTWGMNVIQLQKSPFHPLRNRGAVYSLTSVDFEKSCAHLQLTVLRTEPGPEGLH